MLVTSAAPSSFGEIVSGSAATPAIVNSAAGPVTAPPTAP
jgi:hypothetical protein